MQANYTDTETTTSLKILVLIFADRGVSHHQHNRSAEPLI
jgi:hypothetical protein